MRTPASPDVDVRAGGPQRLMTRCCAPLAAQMDWPCRALSLVAVASLVSAAGELQLQQRNDAHPETSVFILVDVCWRAAAYKLLPRAFQTLFLTRVMHTPQAALDSTANASDFQHRPSAAGSGSSTFDAFPAEKKSVNLHFCRNFFYGWNARACSRRFEICNSHLLIPSGSRAGRGQSSGVS